MLAKKTDKMAFIEPVASSEWQVVLPDRRVFIILKEKQCWS
jgi:hypothetical protein